MRKKEEIESYLKNIEEKDIDNVDETYRTMILSIRETLMWVLERK